MCARLTILVRTRRPHKKSKPTQIQRSEEILLSSLVQIQFRGSVMVMIRIRGLWLGSEFVLGKYDFEWGSIVGPHK